jgi:hypothetical protein
VFSHRHEGKPSGGKPNRRDAEEATVTTARDSRHQSYPQNLDGERGVLVALLVMVVLGMLGIFLV